MVEVVGGERIYLQDGMDRILVDGRIVDGRIVDGSISR